MIQIRSTYIFSVFVLLFLLLFNGCSSKHIPKETPGYFRIGSTLLTDSTYYFPAKKPHSSKVEYQALKRFDLIFVGHNIDTKSRHFTKIENLAALIPGTYTHVLAYIGKDPQGYAYGIEMNTDKEQSFTIDENKVSVGGALHLFCLGTDYGYKQCPKNDYAYGLKSYDYMWAKRLRSDLRPYEKKLLLSIRRDYREKYPFQIPFDLSLQTQKTKAITILDDGHKNGASCAEYFVTLFEDVAGVCLNDVRMDAHTLEQYYLHDPLGKRAYVPIKYSIFFHQEISLSALLGRWDYHIRNNPPRQTRCKERQGIVTPDLLFHSQGMVSIKSLKR